MESRHQQADEGAAFEYHVWAQPLTGSQQNLWGASFIVTAIGSILMNPLGSIVITQTGATVI